MDKVASVRTSTITFAPEAGSQRLRDVINKNLYEEDLMRAVNVAFDAGKNQVKLYFMQGHPTETDEDLAEIPELAHRVVNAYYQNPNYKKGRPPQVTISVSPFIPKPFTPFQWGPQDSMDTLREKQRHIKESITTKKITFNYHDSDTSFLEAVFARGDRRLGKAVLEAHKRGMRFDGWSDCFSLQNWLEVFEDCGIDPAFYANRRRSFDEILPWDHLDYMVSKEFFIRENKTAHNAVTTPHCRQKCSGCGVNKAVGRECFC